MAAYLYRLGRFSFRRRWLVLLCWLLLVAGMVFGAANLAGEPADAFSVPGTESQQAVDMLNERFPEASAGGATARVVFAAPEGQLMTDPAAQAGVAAVIAQLEAAPQVSHVADPYQAGAVSADGRIAYAQVTYAVPALDLTNDDQEALLATAAPGEAAGLTVEYGGNAVQAQGEAGAAEAVGLAVAAVVLFVTFGSLVATGLPLLNAVIGIGVGFLGISIVGGFVDISSATPTLAIMLGIAVAIDYALFIVFRYRQEYVAAGGDGEEAAGQALGTAGSAVVFAGLIVVVTLAGISVVGIPILTQIGLAASGTVAIAVLIALTLLPAMLGFAGKRVFRRRDRKLSIAELAEASERDTLSRRWARFVTRRPVPILMIAVAALIVVALPVQDLRLNLPDDAAAAEGTTPRAAYELLTEGFGPGFNGPLTLVVDAAGSTDPEATTQRVVEVVGGLDHVATVAPPTFNAAGDTALVTVIPTGGPHSAETEELVDVIRDQRDGIRADTGASIAVTGTTASNIDVAQRVLSAMPPYLALVVGLAFLLLLLVFRSILIPLVAAIGFLLAVAGTTFGAVVAGFEWGWLSGPLGVAEGVPVVTLLPIFLIGVSFGLAMDYQIFLVSRMREQHVRGATPAEAVVAGYGRAAKVVTAAALIMMSVFGAFMLDPELLLTQVGFALAFAVMIVAFVVCIAIVPAAMKLLGRSAWWLPRWLDRLLPNVDVEGERLHRRLDEPGGPSATRTSHDLASA